VRYNFEWDLKKARANNIKHKVSFVNAATVFKDPRALTIFDEDHIEEEDRWITIGLSSDGSLLVVHHTFNRINNETAVLRIISSRKATKSEMRQYTEV